MTVNIFQLPGRIIYNEGAMEKIGDEAKKLGAKALIITGKHSAKSNGSLDKIVSLLNASQIKSVVFAEIESDPSVDIVEKGVEFANEEKIDVIVAMGGGSALDAAKAISVMLTNPGSIVDYEKKAPAKAGVPVIAIPTTAGTGSEVSRYVVITDTKRKIKMLIGGETLIPKVAILDPSLTVTMPPAITGATGMDALTHAIESYISKVAQPVTLLHSLTAIKLIRENLIKAIVSPDNIEARSNMLIGQMHAGLAFSNASVALVHSMSRPLGAYFDVPHGLANAILLPEVMKFNRIACPEKYADIAKAMGEKTHGLPLREASLLAVKAVKELYAETGLPKTLKEVKVTRESLPKLAEDALNSGSTSFNPRKPSLADIIQIYKNIYE